jgi:hypothetical protein
MLLRFFFHTDAAQLEPPQRNLEQAAQRKDGIAAW